MRRLMIPSLAVCLAIGLVQRAPAADEPKDIIAKAIKAYGGEEKLSKLRAGKSKAKGKLATYPRYPCNPESRLIRGDEQLVQNNCLGWSSAVQISA